MSIKVLLYNILSEWTDTEMRQALSLMPEAFRQRVSLYKIRSELQSRLAGRLLLRRLFREYSLPLLLSDVKYTIHHKPILDTNFDFSIAHTDGLVLCSGTTAGPIGIDAEKIQDIELIDYKHFLTDNEWAMLSEIESETNFWDIWTIKEAVAKACGQGIEIPLHTLDTTISPLAVGSDAFRWRKLDVGANFAAHLAVSDTISNNDVPVIVEPVTTEELLST